jgi:hypothetical protein
VPSLALVSMPASTTAAAPAPKRKCSLETALTYASKCKKATAGLLDRGLGGPVSVPRDSSNRGDDNNSA